MCILVGALVLMSPLLLIAFAIVMDDREEQRRHERHMADRGKR